MRRHLMDLAAFFVEAQPPALAVGELILDAHADRRADAGEAERHQRDQCAVAQPDVRRDVDLSSSFLASSPSNTGVLPFFTTCFGPRTAAAELGPAKIWQTISQSNRGHSLATETRDVLACAA